MKLRKVKLSKMENTTLLIPYNENLRSRGRRRSYRKPGGSVRRSLSPRERVRRSVAVSAVCERMG